MRGERLRGSGGTSMHMRAMRIIAAVGLLAVPARVHQFAENG